jgi:hypothetical protein
MMALSSRDGGALGTSSRCELSLYAKLRDSGGALRRARCASKAFCAWSLPSPVTLTQCPVEKSVGSRPLLRPAELD